MMHMVVWTARARLLGPMKPLAVPVTHLDQAMHHKEHGGREVAEPHDPVIGQADGRVP
jgi:hypothetical protein